MRATVFRSIFFEIWIWFYQFDVCISFFHLAIVSELFFGTFWSNFTHNQNLSTGQRLLNTGLESRLKNFLGFPIKHHSLSAFSGDLGVKKNKIDSTETITMQSSKKPTTFYRNLKIQKT